MTKASRLIKAIYYKIKYKLLEKEFVAEAGDKIRYIFSQDGEKSNDRVLLVIFSGFAGENIPGRYNYIRSLQDAKCDKLFIKDDFGYNKVGSYYLGEKCELYKHSSIQQLVKSENMRYGPYERVVFMGTSKGGTAAILYGLDLNVDEIVIGSPQYYISDYLSLNDYHKKILNHMIDDHNGYDFEWINNLISYKLSYNNFTGKITMLYSSKEKSWTETRDLFYLVERLQKSGLKIELIDKEYINHNDIGAIFIYYIQHELLGSKVRI